MKFVDVRERGGGLHGCGMYATVPMLEGDGEGYQKRVESNRAGGPQIGAHLEDIWVSVTHSLYTMVPRFTVYYERIPTGWSLERIASRDSRKYYSIVGLPLRQVRSPS